MSLGKKLSWVGLLVGSMVVSGCSSEVDGRGEDASKVTLAGRIGTGSVSTRAFVGVSGSGSSLHVAARELHKRGVTGRTVNVDVSGDGSFKLDVARGSRWVVTIDDSVGGSSIVKFGDGESAISVGSDRSAGTGTVDVGNIHITGGEASCDVVIDGKFGLQSTLVELDDVFQAANGALIEAKAALEEAQKAADDARKAADAARDAADDARKAAEAAANAAGGH
jgi:hypothetical protein